MALNLILLLENDFRFITTEKSFSDLKNVSSICCWFFVVKKVKTILVSVILMLADPNDESPANIDAAKMWREDRQNFKKRVAKTVRQSQEDL